MRGRRHTCDMESRYDVKSTVFCIKEVLQKKAKLFNKILLYKAIEKFKLKKLLSEVTNVYGFLHVF